MEPWDFNLRHLRALLAIMRYGSMSMAAEAVNISQPAITQGLRKLEDRIGTTLFERRADGMLPTEACLILKPRAERALAYIRSTRVTSSQIRAFLNVADFGSYVLASNACGLSQPSLHRAVHDLGLALDQSLFERRGKGIALTDEARPLLRRFRLARAELVAGIEELESLRGGSSFPIIVGAMPLSRAKALPRALAEFHRNYPGIRFCVIEGSFGELVEPLRDGDIDLMIGALREPSPGSDLVQQALFEDQPVIVGRKGHPLAGTDPDISALKAFEWIVPPHKAPLYRQWLALFPESDRTSLRAPIECGSVMVTRELLASGDFLTILSQDQVRVELEAGWLEIIVQPPVVAQRNIGVTTRAGWRPTPMQHAFIEILRECVAG